MGLNRKKGLNRKQAWNCVLNYLGIRILQDTIGHHATRYNRSDIITVLLEEVQASYTEDAETRSMHECVSIFLATRNNKGKMLFDYCRYLKDPESREQLRTFKDMVQGSDATVKTANPTSEAHVSGIKKLHMDDISDYYQRNVNFLNKMSHNFILV